MVFKGEMGERIAEITAEQAYQEDLLQEAYQSSTNPDFQRRAQFMARTFETGPQPIDAMAVSPNVRGTVFEA